MPLSCGMYIVPNDMRLQALSRPMFILCSYILPLSKKPVLHPLICTPPAPNEAHIRLGKGSSLASWGLMLGGGESMSGGCIGVYDFGYWSKSAQVCCDTSLRMRGSTNTPKEPLAPEGRVTFQLSGFYCKLPHSSPQKDG